MNENQSMKLKEIKPWDRKYNHAHIEGIVSEVMKDNRGRDGKERLIGYLYNITQAYPKRKYSIILIMADDPNVIAQIEEVRGWHKNDILVMEGSLEEDIENRDENGYAPAYMKIKEVVGWIRNTSCRNEDPLKDFREIEIEKNIEEDIKAEIPEWFSRTM